MTFSVKAPTVSVIMPVYNGERYLREAIDSVLAQTLQSWELIVVDDGSSDGSPSILGSLSDSRVCVLKQANAGEAAARNAGLAAASGEYIAFLDQDDMYAHTALADYATYMESHQDVGVAYSNGTVVSADGSSMMTLTDLRHGIFEGRIVEQLILSASIVTVPSCTVTRRALLEENKARFDTEQGFGTDWLFWITLGTMTNFGYLDKLTCFYRIHDSNMNLGANKELRRRASERLSAKVISAEWFDQLSVSVREEFYRNLLTVVFENDLHKQMVALESRSVRLLPTSRQSTLNREVATRRLLRGDSVDHVRLLLDRALALSPTDPKTVALTKLVRLSPRLARQAAMGWHSLHNMLQAVKCIGRKTSRPIPPTFRRAMES